MYSIHSWLSACEEEEVSMVRNEMDEMWGGRGELKRTRRLR